MIVLRTKEYSSKRLQLARTLRKTGNLIDTKLSNIGMDVSNKLSKSLLGPIKKPTLLEDSYRLKPKSNIQINREAITSIKDPNIAAKIKGTKTTIGEVKSAIKSAAINPGSTVSKGIETTIRYPIASVGRVTGLAAPVVNPIYAAAPIGTATMGVEVVARRMNPYYAKGAERVANKYSSGGMARRTENIINGGIGYLKGL